MIAQASEETIELRFDDIASFFIHSTLSCFESETSTGRRKTILSAGRESSRGGKQSKPDPRVYQLAVDQLAIPASQISFQSSNAWDAYAASAFGMKVVWCNRYRQRKERLPGQPDYEIETLAELPRIVGAIRDV
jgi:hypothetical protein